MVISIRPSYNDCLKTRARWMSELLLGVDRKESMDKLQLAQRLVGYKRQKPKRCCEQQKSGCRRTKEPIRSLPVPLVHCNGRAGTKEPNELERSQPAPLVSAATTVIYAVFKNFLDLVVSTLYEEFYHLHHLAYSSSKIWASLALSRV